MKNNSALLENMNTQETSYLLGSWRPLKEINSLGTGSVTEDIRTDKTNTSQYSSPIEENLIYNAREQEFLEHDFVLTTFWKTYANYANAIVGSGIIALPYAIRMGGLSALLLMVHSAWASMKSAQLLIKCFYPDGDYTKKQVRFNWSHVACDAFGPSGRILDMVFSLAILTCCSIYLTLCAEALESISPVFAKRGWLLICATIMYILILLFPNLDKMSWLNGLGLLNVLVCAIAVIIVSLVKIIRYPGMLAAGFISYKIFEWRGVFVAYNIFTFTMGTILVQSVFCEMKDKFRFDELSRLVYITIVTLKLVFTLTAFFAFQGDCRDAVTLNIENDTVRMVVTISIVADKFLTTPLGLYPLRLQIESILPKPKIKMARKIFSYFYRLVIPIAILAVSIALSLSVPNFAILTSLAGSAFFAILLYILPVVFWYLLIRNKSKLDIAKGLWIIVISTLSLVGGMYQNLQIIQGQDGKHLVSAA